MKRVTRRDFVKATAAAGLAWGAARGGQIAQLDSQTAVCHLYSISAERACQQWNESVRHWRQQGISRLVFMASMTGKLLVSREKMLELKDRAAREKLPLAPMVFGVGHPAPKSPYHTQQFRSPAEYPFYDGPLFAPPSASSASRWMLPRGWQYKVNEHGRPAFMSACPNAACRAGNVRVVQELAAMFDLVWYDDDFRIDGDLFGGTPVSAAVCYCDECLAELSRRLGRKVSRADVLGDQAVHEEWVRNKVDKLTLLRQTICEAAVKVNPRVSLGLMIRWGGEERDGIDVERLLPYFGRTVNLRVGEGHFTTPLYSLPASQAVEHLAASYHVNWYPREVRALTETTYCDPMPRKLVLKKIALALAAGCSEVAYCPCTKGGFQDLTAKDRSAIDAWAEVFADKTQLHRPAAILRTPAAAYGDKTPAVRLRDRQPFPLLALAGLCSTVVRQGGWRDHNEYDVIAITGRSAWDARLEKHRDRMVIVDGHALLEKTPLNLALGLRNVRRGQDDRVLFESDFLPDGLLYVRGRTVIVPYQWQDVPPPQMARLLEDIRRVIGPAMKSAYVANASNVLPVHYRLSQNDAILLVNLTDQAVDCELALPPPRQRLSTLEGQALAGPLRLAGDEIRVVLAR